jgi:phage FluMu protein Com
MKTVYKKHGKTQMTYNYCQECNKLIQKHRTGKHPRVVFFSERECPRCGVVVSPTYAIY